MREGHRPGGQAVVQLAVRLRQAQRGPGSRGAAHRFRDCRHPGQPESAPIDTLFSTEVACDPKTGANCKWQMIDTGQGWVYSAPQFAPTGESLFLTGAGSNAYSYSDPKADALIRATQTGNGLGAMDSY